MKPIVFASMQEAQFEIEYLQREIEYQCTQVRKWQIAWWIQFVAWAIVFVMYLTK